MKMSVEISSKSGSKHRSSIPVKNVQRVNLETLSGKSKRKKLCWTLERARKAANRGYYIIVPILGYRTLKVAEKIWTNPGTQDHIYHPTFRITGAPIDVINALEAANISNSVIEEVLATSISYDNYKTILKPLYEQTLDSDLTLFAIYKKSVDHKKVADTYDHELQSLLTEINIYNNIIKELTVNIRETSDDDPTKSAYKAAHKKITILKNNLKDQTRILKDSMNKRESKI